jgi:chromosome partitioning protein
MLLQEMLGRAQCILVPVQPSAIDIHATANFIRDLLLAGKLRARNVRLAVVANRVRRSTPVYQPLERFLSSLSLTFLTRLSDSEVYVESAETGVGIFEMDAAACAAEREQFLPIVEWVDPEHRARFEGSRIIELSRPRWAATKLGSL